MAKTKKVIAFSNRQDFGNYEIRTNTELGAQLDPDVDTYVRVRSFNVQYVYVERSTLRGTAMHEQKIADTNRVWFLSGKLSPRAHFQKIIFIE